MNEPQDEKPASTPPQTEPEAPKTPSTESPFRAAGIKIRTSLRAGGRRGNLVQAYPAGE